ncbi:MAG: NAD(P)H-dependent oxidoreductase [Gammaproteobacteria bacterium]|nr:NAD(P)H-dependent oxidoreductase [Gammaproteobacteria bacterium]
MSSTLRILRLDASANPGESASTTLADSLLERLQLVGDDVEVRNRDLNHDVKFIDGHWIGANFTASGERNLEQKEALERSDQLIAELEWADHIVLATPMYNFGVPATLKAWIDQVCRAGITFRYTENGAAGLLAGKSADIVITTGGAPLGSPVDFVSGYLRQVFTFIGIDDVQIIGADKMNIDAQASIAAAQAQIEQRYAADMAREVA